MPNVKLIQSVAEGFAPVVKDHIGHALSPLERRMLELEARISELEARPAVPGPAGPIGPTGPPGPAGTAGAPGPAGAAGKDADPDELAQRVGKILDEPCKAYLAGLVAAIPKAVDGKPGVGMAGAVIDREGRLIISLSDGTMHSLGQVVGKDGTPGRDGKDGAQGADGFNLEDFSIEWIDDRTMRTTFKHGELIKIDEHVFPVVLDCGHFSEGRKYRRGDSVTWGGSTWIALKDAPKGPPTECSEWRMAVRVGRNGVDGKDGKDGERGPAGPPGLHAWQS